MRAVAARDGARVVVAPIPFPIAGPEDALAAILDAVTDRTRLLLVSHVTSPTALSCRSPSSSPRLDRRGIDTLVDGGPRPGDGASGRDGARAPPTGPATATSGCAARRARPCCGSARTGATGSIRWSCRTAPTSRSPGTNGFRHEFDWVGTGDPTGYLTLPAAIDWMDRCACRTVAVGRRSWPRTMPWRSTVGTSSRARSASTRPRRTRCSARWRRCRSPGVADEAAATALGAALGRRTGSRCPIGPWPVRAARETAARPPDPSPHLRPALQRTRRLRATGGRPQTTRRRSLRGWARRPAETDRRASRSRCRRRDRAGRRARRGRGPAGAVRAVRVPPALSGQSPGAPEWVRGVVVPSDGAVVPSDGAVVLGEADGSGLAAETTATPPATSSSPEIAAVRTARRMPLVVFVSAGRTSTVRGGCRFERLEGGFHAELLVCGWVAPAGRTSPGAWRSPLRGA